MAKFSRLAGATSQSVNIFIQNSSVTTGAGLTGFAPAGGSLLSGMIFYYTFTGANAASVSQSLSVPATVGAAFSAGSIVEIDATHQPGLARLDIPNAMIASGKGNTVTGYVSGGTNVAPCVFEIEITAVDNQSTAFGLSLAKTTNITGFNDITAAAAATGVWQDTTSGDFTVSSSIGKSLYTSGAVPGAAGGLFIAGTNAATTITTGLTTTFTGSLTGSVASVTGAVGSVTAQVTANVTDWDGTAVGTISPDSIFLHSGTAQAGGSSTITLDAGASATNNLYQNEVIYIRSGTGANQSNIIASYVGSTKVATVSNAWATNPDSTSVFTIAAFGPVIASVSGTVTANVTEWLGSAVTAATAGTPNVNAIDINNVSTSSVTTINANVGTTQAITFDANNFQKVDLVDILGTAVSTPATAGILDVNVKNMNNVAATSITTINADQGTTQPINFSGTGSTAYVKADAEQLNAQAVTAAAGVTFPSSVASPTNITAGTITTVTNLTNAPTAGDFTATMKTSIGTAVAASAVASVTGNVGGNVTGSVGSVTGAVGSVTGNVGGNVTGSVGSVVAAVGITSNRKKGATATFEFLMQDSTTGAPKTGLTVAMTISKDGGVPASTANAVTEIALGQYQIVLTNTEMTANNIFLQGTSTGAITFDLAVQTQP